MRNDEPELTRIEGGPPEQRTPPPGKAEDTLPAVEVPKEPAPPSPQETLESLSDDLPRIPDVELTAFIGQGGQGSVYRGRQTYLDREVAVKLLRSGRKDPTFAERFRREAKILAGMTHANIVTCYQAGVTENGSCYMVMEFIDGPDLAARLRQHGPLETRHALELCQDLARALRHAHRDSIIHRDVKPENVLLQNDPRSDRSAAFPYQVKLADLGLARTTSRKADQPNITREGVVMGSPSTMAPEQFDDPDGVDFRVDIYGLGCVLYHALTGSPAYYEKTITAIIAKKMVPAGPDARQLRPEIPRPVADLVSRMLACDKEDRPTSYDELIRECEQLNSGSEVTSIPVTQEIPATQRSSHKLLWAAGVLLLVVVGALAGILLNRESGGDPESGDSSVNAEPGSGEVSPLPDADPDPPELVPFRDFVELLANVTHPGGQPVASSLQIPLAASLDELGEEPPTLELEEGDLLTLASPRVDERSAEHRCDWSVEGGEQSIASSALRSVSRKECEFRAPQAPRSYDVVLVVNLHNRVGRLALSVFANNDPPQVTVGKKKHVREGTTVRLEGTALDPEGDTLTYEWVQVNRPVVTLESRSATSVEFVAPRGLREDSHELEFSFVAREANSELEARRNQSVLVEPMPGLPSYAIGTRVPLLAFDNVDFDITWRKWEKKDQHGLWAPNGDYLPWGEGDSPERTSTRGLILPRSHWEIHGKIAPLLNAGDNIQGNVLTEGLGICVEFDGGVALCLRLVKESTSFRPRIEEVCWSDEDQSWHLVSLLEQFPAEPWGAKMDDTVSFLDFSVIWTGNNFTVCWGTEGQEEGDFEKRIQPPPGGVETLPLSFNVFVTEGRAAFKELVLEQL